ncbi:NAD(P)-binding protein [Alternaria alternata]|uniref:NAD(P)-binding protein n=1 Tax=Alternaria alternata TaxID=5599 RepID=A0A177E374_ALTAL|nr:NAD(P)-binding protein [Alternaria alternata]OAG25682.1 NAD(P)-binding protein [Alternaria alternata]
MTSPQKLIVVLGVTGTQGSSVAATFLSLEDWKVRGVTRNPESESAKNQAAKGVELVKGDLDDKESLKAAFIGATAIFLATDFWTIFKQKETHEKASATGTFLPLFCHQQEVQQGLNAVEAASDPKVLQSLERFVFSTLTPVTKLSGGKYTHVYHFDSKAKIEQHIRSNVPEVAKILGTFVMGVFTENWTAPGFLSPQKQADGSWAINDPQLPGPKEFSTIPWVVASRDTGKFVKALVIDQEPGTRIYGVSEFKTRAEVAEIWGKILGAPTTTRPISKDEFAESWPELVREEMIDNFSFVKEFGYQQVTRYQVIFRPLGYLPAKCTTQIPAGVSSSLGAINPTALSSAASVLSASSASVASAKATSTGGANAHGE